MTAPTDAQIKRLVQQRVDQGHPPTVEDRSVLVAISTFIPKRRVPERRAA